MKVILVFCSFLIFSCAGVNRDHENGAKPKLEIGNEVLIFLDKKEFSYSVNIKDIPGVVMDSIGSVNKTPFKIGDRSDSANINLSDAHLGNDLHEYRIKLNFILVNDTLCLISYREGGFGVRDVVDYLQYGENYRHLRFSTSDYISDTVKLRLFLRNNPTPESLWQNSRLINELTSTK